MSERGDDSKVMAIGAGSAVTPARVVMAMRVGEFRWAELEREVNYLTISAPQITMNEIRERADRIVQLAGARRVREIGIGLAHSAFADPVQWRGHVRATLPKLAQLLAVRPDLAEEDCEP